MSINKKSLFPWLVGLGVLFPLFFQLSGGIYRNPSTVVDSQGLVVTLPLPISILTCLIALAVLLGRLRDAKPALAMLFGTVAVLLVSLVLGSDGVTPANRKLLVSVQVILPLMGLFVGQLIQDTDKAVARAYLTVLSLLIPLQLIVTWLQGVRNLADYLYFFTIYSHIQYVTLILVCAFAYALNSLWDEYKAWLVVLSVLMLVYVLRSYSYLTTVAYSLVVLAFIWPRLRRHGRSARVVLLALGLAAAAIGLFDYLSSSGDTWISQSVGTASAKFKPILDGEIPPNVQERFGDWEHFGRGIIESTKTLLVGHPEPMPREIRSSPHNWYIDITYTFGLIALLPIFALVGYTAYQCWRRRRAMTSETWWLAAIVFYLVVVDSNFKVTLRQPYPGIFAFFMWGMLLTRLGSATSPRRE